MIERCDTKYGEVSLNIKTIMDDKHLTVSQISRISGLKFEVVQNTIKIKLLLISDFYIKGIVAVKKI